MCATAADHESSVIINDSHHHLTFKQVKWKDKDMRETQQAELQK